jgi:hypothetical protein
MGDLTVRALSRAGSFGLAALIAVMPVHFVARAQTSDPAPPQQTHPPDFNDPRSIISPWTTFCLQSVEPGKHVCFNGLGQITTEPRPELPGAALDDPSSFAEQQAKLQQALQRRAAAARERHEQLRSQPDATPPAR